VLDGCGRMDALAQLVDRCEHVHISDGNDDKAKSICKKLALTFSGDLADA
jgi:sugar phosphate isomerase/epimerase